MGLAANARVGPTKNGRAGTAKRPSPAGAEAKKEAKAGGVKTASKRRATTPLKAPKSAGALLRLEHDVLVASAMAGGLCDARPRSSPTRVKLEGERFLSLLAGALERSSKAALEERVRAEVREGALAGAPPGEVEVVFDVWKRTLSASSASRGPRVASMMDRLERVALEEAHRWSDERCDYIVVGASAGGLRALQETLSVLSDDLPASILIVQHVSPKSPSLMPLILSRSCKMTVVHAVEGARLFLSHVYVAPPGRHLTVADHRIHLSDAPPVRHSKPAADMLFESAARLYGEHVASIVLSGSDHDGSDGSRAVRDAGGLVIAQHPGTAQFPSMPESAIATGAVELVVALPLLGGVIEKIVRGGRSSVREPR